MLRAVAVRAIPHSSSRCYFIFLCLSEVGGYPGKLVHPRRAPECRNTVWSEGGCPNKLSQWSAYLACRILLWDTYVLITQLRAGQGGTRQRASSRRTVSKGFCFGSQTLLPFPFFHSFALTMAVLIIFMNAPFLCSAGFQSVAVEEVWHVPQDRSRDVSLWPFPNYPHFVKLSESTVMALLWKGSFEWQFVLWLLIYFSFSCWSHDWLLLPSPTHAVQCCSATAFLTFHCMQPHNFYCCAMLWHIGSEEKVCVTSSMP